MRYIISGDLFDRREFDGAVAHEHAVVADVDGFLGAFVIVGGAGGYLNVPAGGGAVGAGLDGGGAFGGAYVRGYGDGVRVGSGVSGEAVDVEGVGIGDGAVTAVTVAVAVGYQGCHPAFGGVVSVAHGIVGAARLGGHAAA